MYNLYNLVTKSDLKPKHINMLNFPGKKKIEKEDVFCSILTKKSNYIPV